MDIYIVPFGEEVRFARSLGYAVTRNHETNLIEATVVVDTIDRDQYKVIASAAAIWQGRRRIVAHDVADLREAEYTDLRSVDYLTYWTKKYRVRIHPSTVKKIYRQSEFVGYDTFFQLLLRSYYLNIPSKELTRIPTIWNLYESFTSGSTKTIVSVAERCMAFYGESVVFGSIITLFEKLISYTESEHSIGKVSTQYRSLLNELKAKLPPKVLVRSLSYLSNSDLPVGLRLSSSIQELSFWQS
jgi:hypothetical protein